MAEFHSRGAATTAQHPHAGQSPIASKVRIRECPAASVVRPRPGGCQQRPDGPPPAKCQPGMLYAAVASATDHARDESAHVKLRDRPARYPRARFRKEWRFESSSSHNVDITFDLRRVKTPATLDTELPWALSGRLPT